MKPVVVKSSCSNEWGKQEMGVRNKNTARGRQILGQHGCFLAHQGAWSKVSASGKPALVMESDATICNAPIDQVRERLRAGAADARSSQVPVWINAGTAAGTYFINPKAAAIGMRFNFCLGGIYRSSRSNVDNQIEGMCKKGKECPRCNRTADYFQCSSLQPLRGVSSSASCWGSGLFRQNRTLKGLHNAENGEIQPGEIRDTHTRDAHTHDRHHGQNVEAKASS